MSALARWRGELKAGKRTPLTFDALWRAACQEAADRETEALRRKADDRLEALERRRVVTPVSEEPKRKRQRSLTKWEHNLATLGGEARGR